MTVKSEKKTAAESSPKELFELIKPYILRSLKLNHDLNNPLAGVIGYCDLLLMDSENLSDTQKEYLQNIVSAAERIRVIVNDLCLEKIALNDKIGLKELYDKFEASEENQIS